MKEDDWTGLPIACLELDEFHRIQRSNAESARLFGRDELVGLTMADVMPVAARFFFQTHVYPALSQAGRLDEVYIELRSADGDTLPVVVNAARRRQGDHFVDVLAIVPMHRRHLHERELIAARFDAARSAAGELEALARVDAVQAQLAIAERLASVGELAAGVAHEINNPLAYVSANVDLLAADGSLRGETAAIVGELREGLGRIRDVVTSLKTLSRVDEGRREPVDVARTVDIALRITGAEVRHRARVEVEVERPSPIVLAEEGRLGQVLINLLVNAAQALPTDRQGENTIWVRAHRVGGDLCEIAIEDNGPGIALDLQSRIFDPFFTTKPIGQGTGLGLSVCHGIITSLGGTIALESTPGCGATFRIRLPALPTATPVATPSAPTLATPKARAKPRVLLVDDEEGVARALRRVLRDCELTWCGSSRAAWERFQNDGFAAFDVVLCDLMMPEMTGMDLYARVSDAAPDAAAKMVFLTGGAFTDAARRFIENVDADTLTKPFDLEELRRIVFRSVR